MSAATLKLGYKRGGEPLLFNEEKRSTHLHIVGGSNRGKSKLLEFLVRQDIIEGRGLCLIDPDGHLYEWLTAWCAEHDLGRKRRLILLDPHVPDRVFGFNPLHVDGDLSSHAEAMQAACAQVWGGESMHDKASLNMGLRAVFYCLAHHKLTLVEALSMLTATDPHNVRRRLTQQIPDAVYRGVWEHYNGLKPQQFDEQLGSTYRRLFEFLDSPRVRAIVGQQNNVIDFRECMDEGAIVLVNLQRSDAFSEGKRRLLGTLIVNDLFQKAQTRPQNPRPFTLYIDECYDYLNSDIARSIDRARKFGLRLVFLMPVRVAHNGAAADVGMVPDRIFALEFPESEERAYFFLEADRATMPVMRSSLEQTSIFRKLLGYHQAWRQGLPTQRYGFQNARTLFITSSAERAQTMFDANRHATQGHGSRLFLFADASLLEGDVLETPILNGRGERVRLLD